MMIKYQKLQKTKMRRNKDFIKNTAILFIGKFSSQFMSLLLIPLLTRFLTASDYGTVDLLQTIISLFVPVLSLRIDSAAFRFLIDCRENQKRQVEVISNIIAIVVFGVLFSVILGIVFEIVFGFAYISASIVNLVILIISSVIMQLLRGLGKNKEYSICCIMIGLSAIALNVVFVVLLKQGAESILWASSIANALGVAYSIFVLNLFFFVKKSLIKKKTIKELLKYSIPMVPEYLSSWVINVSDRAIVSIYLGTAMNGIYTVASKFSNILNSVFSIVGMSWQETASLHICDKDRDSYFSQMINEIAKLFAWLGVIILALLPVCYKYIIGELFMDSYVFIPILLYGNVWRVYVGLTSGVYVALKKTKEVANTTIVAAILNLVVHFVLINRIGLWAASISTFLAYFIMAIYRIIDCRKYVKIRVDWLFILKYTIIFGLTSFFYYCGSEFEKIAVLGVVIVLSIIDNKSTIIKIMNSRIKKMLCK